ncbi:MAG: hypothetical protein ACTHMJ_10455 [Thermomicrobiales bacterium]
MWRGRAGVILISVAIALLTACASGASPTVTRPAPSAPTAAASATAPPTPGATPGALASPGTPGTIATPSAWPPVARLAVAALASEARIPASDIRVVRADPHEWPDTSLGCPEPGRVYLDVITPGYVIVLQAQGRQYEYHTDRSQMVVHCASNQSSATPGTAGETTPVNDLPNPVRLAIAALADELHVATSTIEVVTAEPVEWPNSSLGCPQPGRAYLQIVTPGYRVVLAANGQRYEYHTNNRDMIVRC